MTSEQCAVPNDEDPIEDNLTEVDRPKEDGPQFER
jgi:hypothetical protein